MASEDTRLTYLARANFHGDARVFGIRQADRRAHMYIVGKTGTGKSTLLETLIRQDIQAGRGLALLDPHGDLVERVVAAVPDRRASELIYFNVPDRTHPLGFNPLERVSADKRVLAAAQLLEAFKKLWAEFWGPRSEHILRNALLALLEMPETNLADILRLLDDATFRKRVAERVANVQVRRFWLKEYESYPARFRAESIAPLQNKVGAFLSNPVLAQILTQPKSDINLRACMDEGRILLVNLAKGKLGEDAAGLLGALLTTCLAVAALSRADQKQEDRRDFFVYVDEFPTFTTLSVASMLSELRKYHIGVTLGHQFLSQLESQIRDAIFGNVGTMITFRVGALDAEILEKEFSPEVSALDLISLPNYHIYLKLMVNGVASRPFSAETVRVV